MFFFVSFFLLFGTILRKRKAMEFARLHWSRNLPAESNSVKDDMEHPLWHYLTDIFPKDLVELCCEYCTYAVCSQHRTLFPKALGCLDCVPPEEVRTRCFGNEDLRLVPYFIEKTLFSDVKFQSENMQEIWNYINYTTQHNNPLLLIKLNPGNYVKRSFRLELDWFMYNSSKHWIIEVFLEK